ncbi:MAG TPA: FtsW/RodA/SpoVE family cell cycle protein [Candidatus Paceibacterota bacterium]|nr:FtsW/RodA/SpoVE family cell cycle protein [Candidatus Paceibacterota bacterium]
MLSLFIPVGIIIAASLITLASISLNLFFLQLLWVVVGAGIIVFFLFFDWRALLNYRWFITGLYVLVILLLVFVYVEGPTVRNIKSWIVVGPFNFQPVELMKIALILVYASYFSRRHLSIARWKTIGSSFFLFLVPAILTIIEPDFGAALIFFGIWFGFVLLSGLPPRRIAATVLILALVGVFAWFYVLRDYHRARIIGFFDPQAQSLGVNYSVTQSKIAVGSAGFWGKGYGGGTETQLGFLTVPESDFVFAAFIEQWGMFGGLVVIGGFLYLIYAILAIGARAERNFEMFVCIGTVIVFGMQFFLNAGSELGLLPVIGVTFPFLSYGGSSMAANFFLIGVVNAIRKGQK